MQSGTKKEREGACGHSFDASLSLSPPDHTLLTPLADFSFHSIGHLEACSQAMRTTVRELNTTNTQLKKADSEPPMLYNDEFLLAN